jgi:excisionase family DNA binding protein
LTEDEVGFMMSLGYDYSASSLLLPLSSLTGKEELCMATQPTITRRLLRTKQAAAYLSISDWKLRSLIQDGVLPFIQDREGGPFLLDLQDLDAYIENNKHQGLDSIVGPQRAIAVLRK